MFHYTTSLRALNARKSGIPAQQRFGGVPLTLRQPHCVTDLDFEVFDNNNDVKNKRAFPNEEVLVLALPRQFLDRLAGYEDDPGLCMISADVLSAMRPSSFTAVLNNQPWMNGYTLLPPNSILRSFLIMDKSDSNTQRHLSVSQNALYNSARKSAALSNSVHRSHSTENNFRLKNRSSTSASTSTTTNDSPFLVDSPLNIGPGMKPIEVVYVSTVNIYINAMTIIRQNAFERSLVLLFHYTSPTVISLILQAGLRMSTQGQGDGGVYLSTQGPASYGLGTDEYELNIIKDCFGFERIDEYKGKRKLDIVIIYGCEPSILQQAPGGRDNAKVVSKSTFNEFSLDHSDGNYFLRPDRILGCFYIDSSHAPVLNNLESISEIAVEKSRELQALQKLKEFEQKSHQNTSRIDTAVETIWNSSEQSKLKYNIKTKNGGVVDVNAPLSPTASPSTNSAKNEIEMSVFSSEVGDVTPNNSNPLMNESSFL